MTPFAETLGNGKDIVCLTPKYDKVGLLSELSEEISNVENLDTVKAAEAPQPTATDLREIDVSQIPSPVLARLIEEVRNEEDSTPNAYSRYHNRHNRSR